MGELCLLADPVPSSLSVRRQHTLSRARERAGVRGYARRREAPTPTPLNVTPPLSSLRRPGTCEAGGGVQVFRDSDKTLLNTRDGQRRYRELTLAR